MEKNKLIFPHLIISLFGILSIWNVFAITFQMMWLANEFGTDKTKIHVILTFTVFYLVFLGFYVWKKGNVNILFQIYIFTFVAVIGVIYFLMFAPNGWDINTLINDIPTLLTTPLIYFSLPPFVFCYLVLSKIIQKVKKNS